MGTAFDFHPVIDSEPRFRVRSRPEASEEMSVSRPYPGLVERQTADVFRWRHWHHHHRIHA